MDSGRLVGHMDWPLLSSFDLSQVIPIGGRLLVSHSLPGLPAERQVLQVVTILPGQGGQFQSVVFLIYIYSISVQTKKKGVWVSEKRELSYGKEIREFIKY